jgi:hypothetical protein
MHQKIINDTVKFFFTLQLINKIYHWNTQSYARHIASDKFNSNLLALTDKFVEVYIGIYKVKPTITQINVELMNDTDIVSLFENSKKYFEEIKITDSGLLNIRDELLGEINQTLYLFALH